ncbi:MULTISPECIES: hypothetical protein [unclassified Acinetobacter]|uniref:hypothetical protein n=1 Tax=unclassified Acinetobacter TaxID=196816 RepID=UPI00190A62E5|nr:MULTISPECIES: hypothetical protein [unclassified Acinetobacter]MBK0062383.1 phage tail protein [Acinetobacter sp. S55]MBK0066187.1 phage tail protein [Acinetobacter sp. S54]
MDDEFVGTIVLYVNGDEIDCASVNPTEQAGRKLVSTMNSKGRANKSARTTKSGAIQIEAYIPEEGALDWASISGATLVIESLDGSYRETYSGVGVITVGKKYQNESEATQSLDCFYKSYVIE